MTIITPPENVIAVRTTMNFDRVVASLRNELPRCGFRVVTELSFDRELKTQIGVVASRYTVFVVWHPFSAYQAVLSDPNGGLMVPFNVALHENEGVTTISVLNQPLLTSDASLGVRVLGQELNRRMREVLLHLSAYESSSTSGVQSTRMSAHSRR
jgi:uncharacterized protein (DUF302 family)